MVTVSVNAYDDGDLLDGCLHSIRDAMGDVDIQVIDGRYETHPAPNDNSTDCTPAVAADWGAEYDPAGPFPRERDKHLYRNERAPDDERVLFVDADERLLCFDDRDFDDETAYRVRIFNALIYGPEITYYPRYWYPDQLAEVPRVDRYTLSASEQRTDAITIVHRADLRGAAYKRAKRERLDSQGREWYADYLDGLDAHGHDARFESCPNCGEKSVTTSRITGFDGAFTSIACCTAGDGCYSSIDEHRIGEWRYLPDRLDEGFAKSPARVRLELMDAGWDIAQVVPTVDFDGYAPVARLWVRENLQEADASGLEA